MTIFAIIGNNGEDFDGPFEGILETEVYTNRESAQKACDFFNSKTPVPYTREEYAAHCEGTGWDNTDKMFARWNKEMVKRYIEDSKWTYYVKELIIKEEFIPHNPPYVI